jgi:hypothetical protein
MSTGKLHLADVLFVAKDCRGNISEASDRLGVSRQGLYKYLKRTPTAQDAFNEWRERLKDLAERKLWEAVEDRESWAVSMVLKLLAKDRGYVELTPAANAQVAREAGVQIYLPQKQDIHLNWGDEQASAREYLRQKLDAMARHQAAAGDPPEPTTTTTEARPEEAEHETANFQARLAALPALVQAGDVAGVVRLITELLDEDESDDAQSETEAGVNGDC